MRYERNLPVIGESGQEKLRKSRVGIVGVGGIGTAAALYLAQAGVNLVLVDYDEVRESDLNRQVLYRKKDVGRPKVEIAVEVLADVNPDIGVEAYHSRFEKRYFEACDFVIDGTDNMETRYEINEAFYGKIPFSYGGAVRARGMVSSFVGGGPCLRCLFPEASGEDPVVQGVIGPTAGIVGLLEALEAVKSITGMGSLLVGKLLRIDFESNDYRILEYEKGKGCGCK